LEEYDVKEVQNEEDSVIKEEEIRKEEVKAIWKKLKQIVFNNVVKKKVKKKKKYVRYKD